MRTQHMEAEGAEMGLLGEGFPNGAALEMSALVDRLLNPPAEHPDVTSQPIEQIPDVVVASAFTLIEADLQDAEKEFAERAAQMQNAAKVPSEESINEAIELATQSIQNAVENAESRNIHVLIDIEKDDKFGPIPSQES